MSTQRQLATFLGLNRHITSFQLRNSYQLGAALSLVFCRFGDKVLKPRPKKIHIGLLPEHASPHASSWSISSTSLWYQHVLTVPARYRIPPCRKLSQDRNNKCRHCHPQWWILWFTSWLAKMESGHPTFLLYAVCASSVPHDLKQIPNCFKRNNYSAFKGKGRDFLLVNSYRGITLTSAFTEVLEILLLNQMSVILDDSADTVVHLAEPVCADWSAESIGALVKGYQKEHQNAVTSLKEQRSISWTLFWISESGALAIVWDWLSDSKCSAQVDRTQPRSVIKLLLTSSLSEICLLTVEDQNWHGCFSQNISRFWILLSTVPLILLLCISFTIFPLMTVPLILFKYCCAFLLQFLLSW